MGSPDTPIWERIIWERALPALERRNVEELKKLRRLVRDKNWYITDSRRSSIPGKDPRGDSVASFRLAIFDCAIGIALERKRNE